MLKTESAKMLPSPLLCSVASLVIFFFVRIRFAKNFVNHRNNKFRHLFDNSFESVVKNSIVQYVFLLVSVCNCKYLNSCRNGFDMNSDKANCARQEALQRLYRKRVDVSTENTDKYEEIKLVKKLELIRK